MTIKWMNGWMNGQIAADPFFILFIYYFIIGAAGIRPIYINLLGLKSWNPSLSIWAVTLFVRVLHWCTGWARKDPAGMRFAERLAIPAYAPNSFLRQTLPEHGARIVMNLLPRSLTLPLKNDTFFQNDFPFWDGMYTFAGVAINKTSNKCNTWLFLTPFSSNWPRHWNHCPPKAIPIPSPVHLRRLPAFQLLTSWQVSTM